MIRNTTLALGAAALAFALSLSSANADGYWPNYSFGDGYADCHFEKEKVVVGRDRHGRPIYRVKTVKICS